MVTEDMHTFQLFLVMCYGEDTLDSLIKKRIQNNK